MQLPALLVIGEDGVGRDPAQEDLSQLGREGALGVEGAIGQVVTVTPLEQQLQCRGVVVYLVPAHGHRDVLVEGPAPQPEHLLLLQAGLPGPLRQPALLHHHSYVVGRVGVIRLMNACHLPPIDPHRHVAPLLRHHRQRPLVGHQVRLYHIPFGFIDGANKVQIDPFAIPLAEAGPVITINVQGVGPNRQDEQQAAQQERTNHVPVFPLRCCRQQALTARRHIQAYR